jgi:hypothetical protein
MNDDDDMHDSSSWVHYNNVDNYENVENPHTIIASKFLNLFNEQEFNNIMSQFESQGQKIATYSNQPELRAFFVIIWMCNLDYQGTHAITVSDFKISFCFAGYVGQRMKQGYIYAKHAFGRNSTDLASAISHYIEHGPNIRPDIFNVEKSGTNVVFKSKNGQIVDLADQIPHAKSSSSSKKAKNTRVGLGNSSHAHVSASHQPSTPQSTTTSPTTSTPFQTSTPLFSFATSQPNVPNKAPTRESNSEDMLYDIFMTSKNDALRLEYSKIIMKNDTDVREAISNYIKTGRYGITPIQYKYPHIHKFLTNSGDDSNNNQDIIQTLQNISQSIKNIKLITTSGEVSEKLSACQQELLDLQSKLDECQKQLREDETKRSSTDSARFKLLNDEIVELKRNLTDKDNKILSLRGDLDTSQRQYNDLLRSKSNDTNLTSQNKDLMTRLTTAQTEIQNLNQQIDTLQENLKTQIASATTLTQQIKTLQDDRKILESTHTQQNQQHINRINQLNNQISQLQAQLQQSLQQQAQQQEEDARKQKQAEDARKQQEEDAQKQMQEEEAQKQKQKEDVQKREQAKSAQKKKQEEEDTQKQKRAKILESESVVSVTINDLTISTIELPDYIPVLAGVTMKVLSLTAFNTLSSKLFNNVKPGKTKMDFDEFKTLHLCAIISNLYPPRGYDLQKKGQVKDILAVKSLSTIERELAKLTKNTEVPEIKTTGKKIASKITYFVSQSHKILIQPDTTYYYATKLLAYYLLSRGYDVSVFGDNKNSVFFKFNDIDEVIDALENQFTEKDDILSINIPDN